MRMRQVLWSGVTLALGLTSLPATAQDKREVIATSGQAPAATLGTPVAGSPVKVRAQKDDKIVVPPSSVPPPLSAPTISSDGTPPTLRYPIVMPPSGQYNMAPGSQPMATPHVVPVPDSGQYLLGMPTTIDATTAPMPGGAFSYGAGHINNRWYFSAEYLYWWTREGGLPPLVTTGSPQSATVIESGNLDRNIDPNTQVLFGGSSVDNQGRSGGRFEIGRWFGECKPWAIEFGGFFLGERSTSYHVDSNQVPTLSRPIIVANIPREGVDNFAQPGILAGAIDINTTSNFSGAKIDWRRRLWCGCQCNVDGVLGFRYLNLDESLNIVERSEVIADNVVAPNLNNAPVPRGLQNIITDRFSVNNNFYGGMIGLNSSYRLNCFTLDMGAKVSLGNNHEQVNIEGNQLIVYPDGRQFPFTGGLLARPSNIGSFSQDKFTVVPECNFAVGYQFTPHFKFSVGYDFLYMNNVVRVGDQVDRSVNINGIPYFPQTGVPGNTDPVTNGPIPAGPARPSVLFKETDFWAQGVSVGLLWTW
jgi:Putative beta barrel porin-7 (BBP7)